MHLQLTVSLTVSRTGRLAGPGTPLSAVPLILFIRTPFKEEAPKKSANMERNDLLGNN